MTTVLACPVCDAELTIGATAATCPNTHSFDRARSGYLNLLLSNKRQSADPGDSPAMMRSRRAFLQGGFYDQMAAAANAAVAKVLAGRKESRNDTHVADFGCGEGFFTARLKHALAAALHNVTAAHLLRRRHLASRRQDGHVVRSPRSIGSWRVCIAARSSRSRSMWPSACSRRSTPPTCAGSSV